MNLSDDALRDAAADVCNALLDSLPDPEECQHTFSPQFERKMQRLIRRQKIGYRLLRQVAAVLLALLIGGGVWLMADNDARAAFVRWVQEIYRGSIVYTFFGDAPADGEFLDYRPTWLPEGYVEDRAMRAGSSVSVVYKSPGKAAIAFNYTYMRDGIKASLSLDLIEEYKQVTINGCPGTFYRANELSPSDLLEWIDQEQNIYFEISSTYGETIMCRIAESVNVYIAPE